MIPCNIWIVIQKMFCNIIKFYVEFKYQHMLYMIIRKISFATLYQVQFVK